MLTAVGDPGWALLTRRRRRRRRGRRRRRILRLAGSAVFC
jgi:hypothetical protein